MVLLLCNTDKVLHIMSIRKRRCYFSKFLPCFSHLTHINAMDTFVDIKVVV